MARVTIAFGLMLCATTLIGLLQIKYGRITTMFVPMVFGIPIFICGVISLNPHRRRTWIRLAAAIAAVGGLACLGRVLFLLVRRLQGGELYPIPIFIATGLAIFLLVYAVLMQRMMARRKREGVAENGH